jgi:hypothetical protein
MGMEYKVGASLEILGAASGLAALTGLARGMQALQARVSGLNRSLQQTRTSALAVGSAMMGLGAGVLYGLVRAGDAVARIQDSLNKVGISARMSSQQVQQLFEQARTVGLRESLAPLEVAEFMRGFAQVGIPAPALRALAVDPEILASARLLTVYGKVPGMFQAGTELAAIPHQLGEYGTTPQGIATIKRIIQEMVAAETTSPAQLAAIIRQGAYVLPTGRLLNFNATDIYNAMIAILQATGGMGGGRSGGLSGAGLQAFLGRAFPGVFGGGLLTGKSAPALAALNLTTPSGILSNLFTDGQFDFTKEVALAQRALKEAQTPGGRIAMVHRALAASEAAHNKAAIKIFAPMQAFAGQMQPGQLLTTLFYYAFGATASRIAAFVSSPAFTQQTNMIRAQERAVDPAQVIRQRQQSVYLEQVKQLNAALLNLQYDLGTQVLPMLSKTILFFDALAQKLHVFALAHPAAVQTATQLTAIASGLLILGGALRIMAVALGGFGILISPGGLVAIAVLGLGALAVYVATHWNIITSRTRILAEQFRIAFTLALRHVQQFLHDVSFGLIPGPAPAPRPLGGPGVPGIGVPGKLTPGMVIPVPTLGGGMRWGVVGSGGYFTGGQTFGSAAEAQHFQATHRGGRGAGGGVVINLHPGAVQIHGPADRHSMVDDLSRALVTALQRAGLGVSSVGGTHESPYVLGGAPA